MTDIKAKRRTHHVQNDFVGASGDIADSRTLEARITKIQSHAVQHALKEGFERKHMVEAVLAGMIIEEYPEDYRALICGKAALTEKVTVYLHVVCEYADQVYVEFVTAYVPDDLEWEKPPFRRRGLDKKK